MGLTQEKDNCYVKIIFESTASFNKFINYGITTGK